MIPALCLWAALAAAGDSLPPVEIPETPGTGRLAAGRTVRVERYDVVGATVLSPAEIETLAAPYRGREVGWSDLEALRDAITLAYVSRGYVSSGAVIPDQSIENGVVRVEVVEGKLEAITIETDGRYRPGALRRRLDGAAEGPVNVPRIENELKLLQQDERIRTVNAKLLPGSAQGTSRLDVNVSERSPFALSLELGNLGVPAVGSERGRLVASYANLTGIGDRLYGTFAGSEGQTEGDVGYEIPLGSGGTSLALSGRSSRGLVVEEPFDPLDIRSRTWTYGATIRHAFRSDAHQGLDLTFTGEIRRSESFLLGTGFSFSEGTEDGVAKISVLRVAQEWFHRTPRSVFVIRATESAGVDAFDATVHGGTDIPDGKFLTLMLQAQWARRFSSRDALLVLRLDGQLSDSALFGLEQFALGGRSSVRGYRETTLVRDQGAAFSAEARWPVLRRGAGTLLEIGPFLDGGVATNQDREDFGPRWIAGAGVTARLNLGRFFRLELDWAEALRDLPLPEAPTLQDRGVYLQLIVRTP